jgi:hypothetical protein
MERTVETNPFAYERSELLKFVFWARIRAIWWFHAVILLVVVMVVALAGRSLGDALIAGFGALTFGWLGIWLVFRNQLYGPKNQAVFAPRVVRVTGEMYEHTLENGIATQVPLEHLVDVRETPRWYSLYITRATYFLVPKDAFRSAEDERLFAQRIRRQA